MKKILFVFVILSIVFFSSCEKENSCYECTHPVTGQDNYFCTADSLTYFQVQEEKDNYIAAGYDCLAK